MSASPLGLESGVVRLVPWDPAWPALFAAEADRIARAVRDAGAPPLRLEHAGSTSIPGLAAKPVLDVVAGWDGDAGPAPYIPALVSAGYVHRGESGLPGREFFRRGEPRSHHVHLVALGGAHWREYLAFRDALRADDALRDAYAALKSALAARHPRDREAYIEGKTEFVRRVVAAAGARG